MNKIGFENFRKFEELYDIENNGITFLVGPNNSGKSSVAKAFALINSIDWRDLPGTVFFDNDNYQLDNILYSSFDRLLNTKAKNKTITLHFGFEDFKCSLVIQEGYETEEGRTTYGNGVKFIINSTERNLTFEFNLIENIIRIYKGNQSAVNENNLRELFEVNSKIDKINNDRMNVINKSDDSEFEKFENELGNLKSLRVQIIDKNINFNSNYYYYEYMHSDNSDLRVIISELNKHLNFKYKKLEPKIKGDLKSMRELEKIKIIIQNFGSINDVINNYIYEIRSFDYYTIPTVNSPKRKLLFKDNKEDLMGNAVHVIHDWGVPEHGIPASQLLKKWLKEFNIGVDFEIIPYVNEAFEFNIIKEDGTKIALADEGKGVAQIVFLLLKIGDAIQRSPKIKKTIIIEEPETGLHPSFQSKLTDLFLEVYNKFKIKFIIETHSEYMLRRSQVIVAHSESDNKNSENPFTVYYFSSKANEMPYRMKYCADGTFDKNFGNGFFDEASNSTLDLIKLKRLGKN